MINLSKHSHIKSIVSLAFADFKPNNDYFIRSHNKGNLILFNYRNEHNDRLYDVLPSIRDWLNKQSFSSKESYGKNSGLIPEDTSIHLSFRNDLCKNHKLSAALLRTIVSWNENRIIFSPKFKKLALSLPKFPDIL